MSDVVHHVGFWYTAHGTHQSEFVGLPASGKHATWFGFDLLRIVHGQVAEGCLSRTD